MADLIAAMQVLGDMPEAAVMIDGDYEPYNDIEWPANFRIHVSHDHLELQRAFNQLFSFYPREKCYLIATDHSRPLSSGWARELERAAGDWNIALCDDRRNLMNRFHGGRRMTAFVGLGGELCRTTGWVWPDFCVHLYGDDAWEELGLALGNIDWREDVKAESLSFADGQVAIDANHKRLWKDKPYTQADWAAFQEWRSADLPRLAEKIQSLRC